ncbi:MAG: DUF1343 domain-containing protein [Planctomycetaceae bacterium]|nr:DUF1343 domain-containing protein [Planctomycetaceae bacterium]
MQKTLLILTILFIGNVMAAERLSRVAPEEVGMDSATLALIDAEVQKGLADKNMPGCVVCVGRHGKIAYLKAFGNKQVQTDTEAAREMTIDTVFDMASITKPMATATSIMKLVDQGKIDVDAKVVTWLPEFDTPEKRDITVRQLLLHTAGFIPDNHLDNYKDSTAKAIERLLALKPQTTPGSAFSYSDVNFQLLGILVERVSGKSVADFARENIYEPLGMTETMFCPNEELSRRAAPTQNRALGKVHDPRAFATDGVAGHAGLFSTADDIAVYATMMLNKGEFNGTCILTPETVKLMTTRNRIPGGYRGLGWDMRTGYSSNRGQTMSPQAFGHGGFTGTSLWIDPGFDLFVIFLSNRVHPDGQGNVNPLAGRIGTIAADAVTDLQRDIPLILRHDRALFLSPVFAKTASYKGLLLHRCYLDGRTVKWDSPEYRSAEERMNSQVTPGLEVLKYADFGVLRNKRVGLITNHTACTKDGTFITKYLTDNGVKLTALFSPEHGFTGKADTDGIADSKDEFTGLPIYSLYGNVRKPTPEMLDNVDVLVFDIQDIGSRFYTYTSTMALGMEAAADKRIPFVVLDRPNPIRGDRVEGPILQAGRESFIAHHIMPVQHGMTIGEIAVMIAVERRFDVDLTVVPCVGWKRSQDYAATKLPWINPSPNMKTLPGAYFYPGLGLLEFTNLAVGRGTDTPFELFGAPWITDDKGNSAEKLARALTEAAKEAKLEGVRFEPTRFTPPYREFKDIPCDGIRLILEDPEKLHSVRMGMVIATTLHKLYPDSWQTKNLNTLLLRDRTRDMILEGKSVAEIEADWMPEFERFLKRRELYLLYQ